MSVRIPVVISQSDRRVGPVAEYEEQLITQLMFESGLDATLISDLNSIQTNTTDHLCIEGLKGDFALASWESAQYLREHLKRLGLDSLIVIPVDGSPRYEWIEPGIAPKKIFFVALSVSTPISEAIRQLQQLRESRAIPVVSLSVTANRDAQKRAGVSNSPPPLPVIAENPKTIPRNSVADVGAVASGNLMPFGDESSMKVQPNRVAKDVTAEQEDEFPELDGLMDDLDKFEI